MKSRITIILLLAAAIACSKDEEPAPDANTGLVGEKGNPRFNLVFTNQQNVDLDLHITDPQGNVIYWNNRVSPTGGQLDVDCYCGSCPQGPVENIYWPIGNNTAPKGVYKFQVKYYDACASSGASSSFTVKVLSGNKLIDTKMGSLSSGSSTEYTYNHQ